MMDAFFIRDLHSIGSFFGLECTLSHHFNRLDSSMLLHDRLFRLPLSVFFHHLYASFVSKP